MNGKVAVWLLLVSFAAVFYIRLAIVAWVSFHRGERWSLVCAWGGITCFILGWITRSFHLKGWGVLLLFSSFFLRRLETPYGVNETGK